MSGLGRIALMTSHTQLVSDTCRCMAASAAQQLPFALRILLQRIPWHPYIATWFLFACLRISLTLRIFFAHPSSVVAMSCSLCRLPFQPCARAMFPRRALEGALSQQQRDYLTWSVETGTRLPGCVATMEYLDINLFSMKIRGPARISNIIQWESDRSTYVVMHTTCASIIRHILGASDDSPESFAALCEIEQILGRPCGGKIAGRFRDVDYEAAGWVDVERFWKVDGPDDGSNDFDWQTFQCSELSWVIARPDVFPKFPHEVSPMRLAQIGCPKADTCDIITTQPVDILNLLLPYLPNRSLLSLLSTCPLLRHHALTTFRPMARAHTLELCWAIPLEFEYKCASPEVAPKLAHPTNSPQHGDWWLYLSHAHKKSSMRARRRIWALAHELRRAYLEKRPCSGNEDIVTEESVSVKSEQRLALDCRMAAWSTIRTLQGIKTRVFQT